MRRILSQEIAGNRFLNFNDCECRYELKASVD